ncbi:hypothetical protein ACXIUS_29145 [Bosea thiooxidans]
MNGALPPYRLVMECAVQYARPDGMIGESQTDEHLIGGAANVQQPAAAISQKRIRLQQ